MECKIHKKMYVKNCKFNDEDSFECLDLIIDKLEKKFNCCLHPRGATKKPHGHVSILHENPHNITVCFYEEPEKLRDGPGIELIKLDKIPTEREIIETIA